jgi:diguanylate cyclase (GGDEF)-like protein
MEQAATSPAQRHAVGSARPGLATAGLAVVLAILVASGMWTAFTVNHAARLVVVDSRQQRAWEEARYQLAAAAYARRELLERDPDAAVAVARSAEALRRALLEAARPTAGDQANPYLRQAQAAERRYRHAVERMQAAVDAGRRAEALAVRTNLVEPAAVKLAGVLHEGAGSEHDQVSENVAQLGHLSGMIVLAAPALFTVGVALLAGSWFLLVGYQRRHELHLAERRHDALHDPLTSLPNRVLFRDLVGQAVRAKGWEHDQGAVLLLDLDRFKEVNDTLGHHHGDALLQQLAARLRASVRTSDTVARLGGDEFAILLPRVDGPDGARAVARKLLDVLAEPFLVEGLELDVDGSVGVAVWPEHGRDAGELLRRADVAMYAAKHARAGFAVYDAGHDQNTPRRLGLLGQLRRAIDQGELVLHYQPQVEMRTGKAPTVEALVRWQHPTDRLLAPGEFIPLAERTGLIEPLTTWVVRAALDHCRRWRDAGHDLAVAVNVSASSLLDPRLPNRVATLLDETGVPPRSLILELTESSIMTDPTRALAVLSRLHGLGVRLAIDDFGTGYSSMAYLSNLPVDELKIDRSFVSRMHTGGSHRMIVRSTLELGHQLGMHVVAEGVEEPAAWRDLAALGCDFAQGFLLARPMPATELDAWLAQRPRRPAGPLAGRISTA